MKKRINIVQQIALNIDTHYSTRHSGNDINKEEIKSNANLSRQIGGSVLKKMPLF